MIEISERITRVTTRSDCNSALRDEGAGRSQVANGRRVSTGVRVTLEFNRSVALSPGQEVRWRHDFTGDGHFLDCVGIPQPTHFVARRGQPVVYHYRLSHWIPKLDIAGLRISPAAVLEPSTALIPEPARAAPAIDRFPA